MLLAIGQGDFNYDLLYSVTTGLTPLIFLGFIFLASNVVLNLLIALLSSAYDSEIEEDQSKNAEMAMIEHFFSELWPYGRGVDKDNVEKGPWHEALETTFREMFAHSWEVFRKRIQLRVYHPKDGTERTTLGRFRQEDLEVSVEEQRGGIDMEIWCENQYLWCVCVLY
jgi:hypothetical protein